MRGFNSPTAPILLCVVIVTSSEVEGSRSGSGRAGIVIVAVPKGSLAPTLGRASKVGAPPARKLAIAIRARDEAKHVPTARLAWIVRPLNDLLIRLIVHHAPPRDGHPVPRLVGFMRAPAPACAVSRVSGLERAKSVKWWKAPCRPLERAGHQGVYGSVSLV